MRFPENGISRLYSYHVTIPFVIYTIGDGSSRFPEFVISQGFEVSRGWDIPGIRGFPGMGYPGDSRFPVVGISLGLPGDWTFPVDGISLGLPGNSMISRGLTT